MTIAAYAIGATQGVIYCRAEYPLAIKRLNIAIEQARTKGYLGKDIYGKKGWNFDIYVKEGAGAFVCGEETALMASVEGRRGMPRKRPPFLLYRDYGKNLQILTTLKLLPMCHI
jgi:NADH-quinone oxidoreductase subunit F